MNEAKVFLDRIRQGLLALEVEIQANKSKWGEYTNASGFSSTSEAISIVFYLERIALDSRQFELAGLCRYLNERCQALGLKDIVSSRKISRSIVEANQVSGSNRLTPSDIGGLFNPRIHGAYVNLMLKELGLVRQSDGGWVATDTGILHAIQRSNRDGKKPYVIWKPSVLGIIEEALHAGIVNNLPNPWIQSGKRGSHDNRQKTDLK